MTKEGSGAALNLKSYADLIGKYLDKEIDTVTFEKKYLAKFKEDDTIWDDRTFDILNSIFSDLDAFCDDPRLMNELDLDESQLRVRTTENFQNIKRIIEEMRD